MNSVYGKYLTKMAFIWFCCFVLFFFVDMLLIAPQRTTRNQLEKQLAEKKRFYESAINAAQAETHARLNEEIAQMRNRLKDFVVDAEDAANLTFDISQIASTKAISSFNIETKKEADKSSQKKSDKNVRETFVDIGFSTADFGQFAALLNELERHQPVIFVDKFSITRTKSNAGNSVKMNLAVLVRKMQNS
ncbi:MAG: hypothetical protein JW947_03835 [Sedimentisphaerales bacterium]|nr:hypothetical protein [Sedimentisphaerales bacterium]